MDLEKQTRFMYVFKGIRPRAETGGGLGACHGPGLSKALAAGWRAAPTLAASGLPAVNRAVSADLNHNRL